MVDHFRPFSIRRSQGARLMAEKSPRRLMLETSLADDPADAFLRYGLAVQCLREGDIEEGRAGLIRLIADLPADTVAAHQQLGQSYLEAGELVEARAILEQGITLANKRGDWHAEGEMQGLLDQTR
jgi:thioredoxin-like negative regulator of GroEL